MQAQWQDFLTQQGAQIAQHQVTDFGQSHSERSATAQGTIMADLSHLGLLEVQGDDATTFLQGQLTNDVRLLDGNNSQYAGYCNPKGRLLGMFLLFAHQGHVHLQLHGALKDALLKRLKMYVLRSKVVISDVSDEMIRVGLAGPRATALLENMFDIVPQQPHQLSTLEQASLLRLPGTTPRYEIFTQAEFAKTLWSQLRAEATPVGATCWEWLEIQAGIPEITPATQEAFVPQMVNLDVLDGINFKKGCYTGQEIVARTHYLGKVKRRTVLAHLDGEQSPQPGEPIFEATSTEPIGQIVRVAPAPAGGFDLLTEVRLESLQAGVLRWPTPQGATLHLQPMPYPVE